MTLPDNVQAAVDKAQAAFAAVSESRAKVAQAKADAEANEIRQQGYSKCPACATIDEMKAIPPNVTIFAPRLRLRRHPGPGQVAPPRHSSAAEFRDGRPGR